MSTRTIKKSVDVDASPEREGRHRKRPRPRVPRSRETYRLTRIPSGTRLDISADMVEQYYDDMAAPWDRALAKAKALAEAPRR